MTYAEKVLEVLRRLGPCRAMAIVEATSSGPWAFAVGALRIHETLRQLEDSGRIESVSAPSTIELGARPGVAYRIAGDSRQTVVTRSRAIPLAKCA